MKSLFFSVVIGLAVFLASCDKAQDVPLTGIKDFKYKGGLHKEGRLTYDTTPPAGGEHNQSWQNCGVYAEPIAPENAVHSLEHGAVWITYQFDLPQSEVDKLREYAKGQTYMLVSPFQFGALDKPIYIVAWNHSLGLEKADDKRIAAFIKKFKGAGDAPEIGASCTGATGTPIQ